MVWFASVSRPYIKSIRNWIELDILVFWHEFALYIKFKTIWKSFGLGSYLGSKGVYYIRQLKVYVIFGRFSILSVFLLSLLSLVFILGYDIYIYIKSKWSITIRISCILMRYYGKRRGGFKRTGGIKGREIKRLVF